ncbi:MAG: hypothetical protein OEU92_22120 [Alphaproteobacteria bacterium]|nr:hypothetical protein [Alphaproteobacteria bacterium]
MSRLAEPFLGRWRIDHMDEYDQDYLDLVEPAFIRFDRGGSGEFVFGAVTGQLDCRYNKTGVTFTWLGQDEMDDVSSRGHVVHRPDGTIAGHLYRHLGDDSAFTACQE